jgi:hypothetical protein
MNKANFWSTDKLEKCIVTLGKKMLDKNDPK